MAKLAWGGVGAVALCGLLAGCQEHEAYPVQPRTLQVGNTVISVTGKQLPPNIMLAVDSSGSMTEAVTGTGQACTDDGTLGSSYNPRSPNPCKWNDLKAVLADPNTGFLTENQGLARFGLMAFPADSGTCDVGRILVPIGDDVQPLRDALLSKIYPAGGTPTAASLVEAGKDPALAVEEANRRRFVMLLTDGLPNCNPGNQAKCEQCRADATACGAAQGCRPTDPPFDSCDTAPFDGAPCLDADNLVEAVTALRQAGVDTFVIGLGRATASGAANEVLNRAAVAGGQPRKDGPVAYYQADSVAQLRAFLQEILQAFPCAYQLDPIPQNPALVSVTIRDKQREADTSLARGTDWDFTSDKYDGVRLIGGACSLVQNAPPDRYEVRISFSNPL